ncbi:hypothetical protein Btru_041654, partial [Bulinus truncatus]
KYCRSKKKIIQDAPKKLKIVGETQAPDTSDYLFFHRHLRVSLPSYVLVMTFGRGRGKVGHFSNSRVGLFSKQQGWLLQQTARLASSANSRVVLFSSSKAGLFSRRQDGQIVDNSNKARSHPPEPIEGSILHELEKGHHIVDIKNVKLTKSQIHEAAEFLEKKKDMSQLSIVNCHLHDEDMEIIKDALITSPSKPVVLNLNNNQLTSGCIEYLLQLFKNKPSIEAILLTGCNLGDEGVKKLVDGLLKQQKDLLSGEKIEKDVQSDDETNRELRELDLTDCNFGDEGIEALCSLIRSGMAIDTLNLSMNKAVTQKGWILFAHTLTIARVLETLTLDNNYIGNEGLEEIARSLYDNSSLAALDLNNIQVTDKGGKCLMELLKRNTFLLEINLQENSLSEQLIDDINKYISLNKSIHNNSEN